MSKSLKRVRAALDSAGLTPDIRQTDGSRTAEDAAAAVGCSVDQIVKSLVFEGETSREIVLFLTSGGNRVDADKAARLAGEPLSRADADLVRARTGFAIGGVAPVGHLQPVRCFMDAALLGFGTIWAAAGTPTHVFAISPAALQHISSAQVADFTSE